MSADTIDRFMAVLPGFAFSLRLSPDGSYTMPFLGPGAERFPGISPDSNWQESDSDFFSFQPVEAFSFKLRLQYSARDLTPVYFQGRISSGNDNSWVEIHCNPERESDGGTIWHGFCLSVDHHKKIQNNLVAQLDDLRDLIEHSPDLIVRCDKECRFVYANTRFRNVMNVDFDILVGRCPTEIPGLYEAEYFENRIRDVIETGNGFEFEHEIRIADGSFFWASIHMVPEFDESGSVVYVQLVSRNITKRKELEAKLIEQQKHFTAIAENIPGVIFSFRMKSDRSGHLLYTNQMIDDLFGFHFEDLKEDITPLFTRIHEEDLPRLVSKIDRASVSRKKFTTIFRINHPVKGEIWVRLFATPIVDDNPGILWQGMVFDITGRKENQERLGLLEQAINLSSDAIYLIDQKLRFTYVNDTACRNLGYSREELLSMGPPDIDIDIGRETAQRMMDTSPEGVEAKFETRHRRRDGRILNIELRGNHFTRDGTRFSLSIARDITERKRMEEELKKNERNFRSLAENLPDNIVRFDPSGRYLYINPSHEHALGLTADEVIGTVIPDTRQKVKQALAQVVSTGQAVVLLLNPVHLNGETRIHEISLTPEFDNAGKIVSVLGVGRDITETYRMQETITRREHEVRTLVENATDTIARYDRDCRRTYANPAFATLANVSMDDLIGKTPSECPGGPDTAIYEKKIKRTFTSGEACEFELKWSGGEGREICSLISLTPERNSNGEVTSVLAVGRDVTELHKMQQSLRKREAFTTSLLEAISVPVFYKDKNGKYLGFNRAFESFMGVTRDRMIGKTTHEITSGELADEYRIRDLELLEAGGIQQYESRLINSRGREHDVIFHKAVFRDEKGEIAGVIGTILDITERKQIERHLEQQTIRLESILRTIPDMVWLKDSEGKYLICNHAFEDSMGRPEVEIIGKTDYDIVDESLADLFRKNDRTAIENGDIYVNEEWIEHRNDHRMILLETRKLPVYDSNSELIGVLGIGREITEKRALEAAIRESEKKYSAAFYDSPAALSFMSITSMRYIETNQVFLDMTEYSTTDILGRTYEEIEFWVDSAERDRFFFLIQEHGSVFDFPLTFRTKTGKLRRATLAARMIRTEEELFILSQMIDITEKEEARLMLQKLNRNLEEAQRISHIGSWELNLSNNHLAWSDEVFRIFEIDPDTFGASYETFIQSVHPDDREKVDRVCTDSLKLRKPYEVEHRLQMADGRIKYVLERGETEFDENGNALRLQGTVQDLTERQVIEQRLAEQEREKARIKGQREFLTNMSHELKTPLHSILGFSKLLAERIHGEKEISFVRSIQNGGKMLENLINDFLDLSRLESGNFPLQIKPFCIRESAEELRSIFSSRATALNLECSIHIPDSIPDLVFLDELRFKQILINLIDNGLKYTGSGFVRTLVDYSIDPDNPGTGTLTVRVEDSGPGIPESQRERIFESFVQLEWEGSEPSNGTGLGLAIVKKLVERMNGTIEILTGSSGGALFLVSFPQIKYQNQIAESPKSGKQLPGESPHFYPATILISMQSQKKCETLREMLTDLPFYIVTSTTLKETVEQIHNLHPDLLIQDLEMEAIDPLIVGSLGIYAGGMDLKTIGISGRAESYIDSDFSSILSRITDLPGDRHELLQIFAEFLRYEGGASNSDSENERDLLFHEIGLLKSEINKWVSGSREDIEFGTIRQRCLNLEKLALSREARIPAAWARLMQKATSIYSIRQINQLWTIFDKLIEIKK